MIEYEAKIKKWGNSAGVIVPKELLHGEHLKQNQTVRVIITPKKVVKVSDVFGLFKK